MARRTGRCRDVVGAVALAGAAGPGGREARSGVAAERVVRVEAEQLPVLAQVLLLRLRAMVGAGTASRLDSRRNGCTLRDLN